MERKGAFDSANGAHKFPSIEATPEGVDGVQSQDERVSPPTMDLNPSPNVNGNISDPKANGYTSNNMNGINSPEGKHAVNGNVTNHDGEAPPPIAIVGMGMRLPGGINGKTEFWDMLINEKNGRCIVPEDRYNVEAFYDPSGRPGTVKSKFGYFLNHVDIQHLDTSFFSMNRKEVEKLDPQQKLLLEVIWECMENAGQVGWRGKNIGCYVGVFGEDWLDMAAKEPQHLGMYRITQLLQTKSQK